MRWFLDVRVPLSFVVKGMKVRIIHDLTVFAGGGDRSIVSERIYCTINFSGLSPTSLVTSLVGKWSAILHLLEPYIVTARHIDVKDAISSVYPRM